MSQAETDSMMHSLALCGSSPLMLYCNKNLACESRVLALARPTQVCIPFDDGAWFSLHDGDLMTTDLAFQVILQRSKSLRFNLTLDQALRGTDSHVSCTVFFSCICIEEASKDMKTYGVRRVACNCKRTALYKL